MQIHSPHILFNIDTPVIHEQEFKDVENYVNQLIRDDVKINVSYHAKDAPAEELVNFRTPTGLPADHTGDIRVVTINGIESTMCCGTHVSSLSQLQAIKLLSWERSKRKGQCNLYFVAGNRVLVQLEKMVAREQKLGEILKTNPVRFADFVGKLVQSQKVLTKNLSSALKELAIHEAGTLKKQNPTPAYYSLHRKEGDVDFMTTFIKEIGSNTNILLFLSVGDEKESGNIVLYGDEKAVAELGPKVAELLDGKGAGKDNKYQAKVNNMSKRKDADALIQKYFAN